MVLVVQLVIGVVLLTLSLFAIWSFFSPWRGGRKKDTDPKKAP